MATTPPTVSLTPNVTNTVAAIASNLGFVAGDPVINSKIALLILQALIIISLSRGLGFLFGYLKEPLVIAEMVAGILLGPTVMGRIPGFTENIFPPSSLPLLQICAQLGLMLFMFVVGLELDVGLLKRKLKSAVAASVIGVIVPQIVAVPLLWVFYKDEFLGQDHHVSRGAFFLFLGIVLAISALPVLARIMSEYNFLNTPLGVFTMTATTVDDMIAWPMLALAIALAGAKKTITILYILLLVVADIVLLFLVVRPAFKLVARFAAQRGTNQTALFLSLVLMLALSFFCEISGLTYLVGAFQAGLVVPRTNGFATALAQKIEHVVVVIFMPLFFAFSGIRTQFAVLNTARLWGLTFLLTFAAALSKMVACIPSARYIAKLSWRDSIAFGILMNTKGLVALISINLGLDYSIISRVLFAQMLIMVLINTCITGPLIALLDCLMPAPIEAQPTVNRDVALLYSPGTETANSLSLLQLASTLNSPVRSCDLLLFRLLDADEPSVYIALSRNKDPVAAAAKSLARKNDVKLRVQYETSSAQVDALVQAAEHAQFVFAAWTHQALPGELAAALRRTSRALLFLVEPADVSAAPPDSDESGANSLSMPRVATAHSNKPPASDAAPAPAPAPAPSATAASSSSAATDSGDADADARVRLLLPCLPERMHETEGVLEVVMRMMQGSRDMELVFVHIVPTGQSELIRQQGRLLLRLLNNARGMQVVWRETEQPADFGVIRTEARTQRATHVVLPLESPASWAEELSSLSVPVLLVRPELRKEKEAEEPLP